MEFDEKMIAPILEAKYDSFTQSEKEIADFFLQNKENMISFSIEELSKKLFVSKASISRFVKKCGFKGYREFLYQYNKSNSINEEKGIIADSTRTVLNTYQELLTKTYSLMDDAQISRIVNLIGKMKRVIVCGGGSSGLAATEMESRFMRIGIDIDSLTSSDRIRIQAVFCNEESLVIGISVGGRNEAVLYLLQEAHQRGSKTILITSRYNILYKEFCDEVVLIASIKGLESGNSISPQFPILIIMDIIYNEYVYLNKKEKLAMHGDTLRALQSKKHYMLEQEELENE